MTPEELLRLASDTRYDIIPAVRGVLNQAAELTLDLADCIKSHQKQNQHCAELIDQAPHDNLCQRQWTDAGVPRLCDCWKKEAEDI